MLVNFNEPVRNYNLNKSKIDAAVSRVLDSGYYILGSVVEDFERQFADYCNVAHCIGVASGTDALLIALRAAGVGSGDEVITVSNAGGYSSIACHQIGAIPVYVDVEPDTLLMDTSLVAAAMTDKTRAIIATHLFGAMVDMKPLKMLASSHEIMLIEDCAQAHGALYDGKRAGSIGDIGTFSFYPTKNLGALGDGGALTCSDNKIADSIRELHQYGWQKKYSVHRPYGTNSRLDPVQAAILDVKLPQLDAANERRRDIVSSYMDKLGNTGIQFCHHVASSYVGHLCVVRHPERSSLLDLLGKVGIATDIHYPVLDFDQPGLQELECRTDPAPVSRLASQEIFSLPLYPELSDQEITQVCNALEKSLEVLSTDKL